MRMMKMIMVVIMALFMTMTVIVQIRGWWCWWCGEWWRLNGMVLKKSYTYLSYLYLFCLFLVMWSHDTVWRHNSIIHHNLKKKMSWMYCSFLISSSEIVHPPWSGYNLLLLWFFSVLPVISEYEHGPHFTRLLRNSDVRAQDLVIVPLCYLWVVETWSKSWRRLWKDLGLHFSQWLTSACCTIIS